MLLTGCKWPLYKADIQQGNIITPTQLAQLKLGMSKEQASALLGTPLLDHPDKGKQWEYIYYYHPARGKPIRKKVILVFEGDQLVNFQSIP